jgi:hypothetical protein
LGRDHVEIPDVDVELHLEEEFGVREYGMHSSGSVKYLKALSAS